MKKILFNSDFYYEFDTRSFASLTITSQDKYTGARSSWKLSKTDLYSIYQFVGLSFDPYFDTTRLIRLLYHYLYHFQFSFDNVTIKTDYYDALKSFYKRKGIKRDILSITPVINEINE